VGAAAQIYYGKNLNELSIAELATIAGLPQAPSAHNPIANPKAALKRRNHVLERLLEEKYINQTEYETAIAEPINASYHGPQINVEAPYVAEMIRQSLYAHFGEEAYTQGFKVYTTLNTSLQNSANHLIEQHLLNYEARHGYHGPITHVQLNQDPSPQDLSKLLNSHLVNHDLIPGVVTQVQAKSLKVYLKDGRSIDIEWSGLSWARPALRNGWTGSSPQYAKQICQRGDIIYARKVKKNWQLAQIPNLEAALLSLNPQNGSIQALVGGFNFQNSKFNRVTQSQRQPGSSFKPFIYAAALSKGYNLSSIVNDAPIVIRDTGQDHLWRPHNVNNTFNGPTRLRDALAHSRNLVSIRLLDDIGVDYAIQYVTRFGFNKNQLPHALSLALGSLSLSPMELTTAYAVIANGGYQISPYLIDRITNRHGEVLFQANPARVCPLLDEAQKNQNCAQRVIPQDLAFLIHSALQSVIEEGTAVQAKSLGRHDLAGKTGTTNDQVDAWFAGYHPQLVTTTWFGYDTPKPIHEYAAALALPLWIDFMKVALKNLPEQMINPPENVQSIFINPRTGQRSSAEQGGMPEFFSEQSLPVENANPDESNAPINSAVSEENLF
jgi:penicillin-binding protein 1A